MPGSLNLPHFLVKLTDLGLAFGKFCFQPFEALLGGIEAIC